MIPRDPRPRRVRLRRKRAILCCDEAREAISARLDGERPPFPAPSLDAHLVACQACRDFESAVLAIGRRLSLRASRPVPDDLVETLVALMGPPPRPILYPWGGAGRVRARASGTVHTRPVGSSHTSGGPGSYGHFFWSGVAPTPGPHASTVALHDRPYRPTSTPRWLTMPVGRRGWTRCTQEPLVVDQRRTVTGTGDRSAQRVDRHPGRVEGHAGCARLEVDRRRRHARLVHEHLLDERNARPAVHPGEGEPDRDRAGGRKRRGHAALPFAVMKLAVTARARTWLVLREVPQASAVPNDERRGQGHGPAGDQRVEEPARGQRYRGDVVSERPDEVAADRQDRPASQARWPWQRAFRSSRTMIRSAALMATSVPDPMARPSRRRRQRRTVVHAVSDHGDRPAVRLKLADERHLVRREGRRRPPRTPRSTSPTARAVGSLSPVSRMQCEPERLELRDGGGADGRTVSATAMAPTTASSRADEYGGPPERLHAAHRVAKRSAGSSPDPGEQLRPARPRCVTLDAPRAPSPGRATNSSTGGKVTELVPGGRR